MSKINQLRATKEAIRELEQQLEALSRDEGLKKEMEFEEKLRALMGEYNKSLRDINAILDPQSVRAAAPRGSVRRQRKTKRYTNPHTGAVIETRGGNHKELKEWKANWGNDTVESWAVVID